MLLKQQPSLIFSDEPFCNHEGSIRVKLVRKIFGEYLKADDLPLITDLYVTWRDTVELLPFRKVYLEDKVVYAPEINTTGEIYSNFLENNDLKSSHYMDYVFFEAETHEWVMKKCCKRGNNVYINLINKKFKPLFKSKNHKQFFSTKINKNRKRIRRTKLLYVTGTCDHKTTGDISNSWKSFGLYWNSFITNIREQFGGAEYIRAWQSQENGYPHFHALIYFPNFDFSVVYWAKDKSWRIHNRQKHKGKYVRDKIKEAWKAGFLEIECCDNTKKALRDLLKYITRDLEGGESDLTNAMVWYFGKQSYSISKGFTKLFGPNIVLAEPGNDDLINAERVIPSNNSKKRLIRIEVFPTVRRENLDFSYTKDVLDPWKIPDPPPKVVSDLEIMALNCKPSSVRSTEDGVVIVIYKRI